MRCWSRPRTGANHVARTATLLAQLRCSRMHGLPGQVCAHHGAGGGLGDRTGHGADADCMPRRHTSSRAGTCLTMQAFGSLHHQGCARHRDGLDMLKMCENRGGGAPAGRGATARRQQAAALARAGHRPWGQRRPQQPATSARVVGSGVHVGHRAEARPAVGADGDACVQGRRLVRGLITSWGRRALHRSWGRGGATPS